MLPLVVAMLARADDVAVALTCPAAPEVAAAEVELAQPAAK